MSLNRLSCGYSNQQIIENGWFFNVQKLNLNMHVNDFDGQIQFEIMMKINGNESFGLISQQLNEVKMLVESRVYFYSTEISDSCAKHRRNI